MNKLNLIFIKKDYPYADELYDSSISWGYISLEVCSPEGRVLKKLFEIEWNFRDLIEWLSINKTNLLQIECPLGDSNDKCSIAQLIYIFYNSEQTIDESLLDEVFEYRNTHGIRFALRGTDLADIYLGKKGSKYEVSFFDGVVSWAYDIDLISFYDEIG